MAAKFKIPQPWVEVHLRTTARAPKSFEEVRFADYKHHGHQIPWRELSCVSDVYGMFHPVPAGFEEWFPRPVGPYDMLVLCRPVGQKRVMAHPLMVVPTAVQDAFLLPDAVVTIPKCWMSGERVEVTHHGVILVGCPVAWRANYQLK